MARVITGSVPHFIGDWRRHRGLSQNALAEAIGVSRACVSRVERHQRRYDEAFLKGAARALGVDLGELIVSSPADVLALTPDQRQTLEAWRRQLRPSDSD